MLQQDTGPSGGKILHKSSSNEAVWPERPLASDKRINAEWNSNKRMNQWYVQFQGLQDTWQIPSRWSSPVDGLGLHSALIFIDAQSGGFLNEEATNYKVYQAIKNVTLVKPVRYLCKWFLAQFQNKLSVIKGHRVIAIK